MGLDTDHLKLVFQSALFWLLVILVIQTLRPGL